MDNYISIFMEKTVQYRHRGCRSASHSSHLEINSIEKIQLRMMVATFNGNPSITKSLATVIQMLVMKQNSSPSTLRFFPLSVGSQIQRSNNSCDENNKFG